MGELDLPDGLFSEFSFETKVVLTKFVLKSFDKLIGFYIVVMLEHKKLY